MSLFGVLREPDLVAMLNVYIVIFLTLVASLLASATQFLFKRAMPDGLQKVRHVLPLLKSRDVLSGIFLNLAAFGFYLYALASAPLSFVYPVFASTFIFTGLIAHFMFKERLSIRRILGMLIIFVGIAIISLTF